jgi:predicted transcriptional regulator
MSNVPLGAPTNQELTAEIVAAYVRRNQVTTDQLGTLISTVHQAIGQLGNPPAEIAVQRTPAVPIRRSVTRDHVICLDCGYRGLMLKRHLTTAHGLNVDAYRARWNLPLDHAMVAPAYSERRAEFAKQFGLGQRGRRASKAAAPPPPAPKRRGRPRATAATPAETA